MVTIDYGNTFIIDIPQTFLTLVSGTFYRLDTDAFRLELKALEASSAGMPHPRTHNHNTTVTVAGITYARTIEILSPYSVRFQDGQYSVELTGSNNNIFDVENGILVQNQVQVIPTNSAGLIQISSGSGLSVSQDAALTLIRDLAQADQVFDESTGLLHYYFKGTTTDIIPAKSVVTQQTQDTSITE